MKCNTADMINVLGWLILFSIFSGQFIHQLQHDWRHRRWFIVAVSAVMLLASATMSILSLTYLLWALT